MKHIAIIVASVYGQTRKIADCLRQQLENAGTTAETFVIEARRPRPVPLEVFDAVVLGAPVYSGRFPAGFEAWTRTHLQTIQAKPSAFFSVSLNAADKRPEAREADDRLLRQFIERTGLKPDFVASFAGALQYTRYNFFIRWIMKRISASVGGPTDTFHDYEMTDWNQVSAFAEAFAQQGRRSLFATPIRLPGRDYTDARVSAM
ncbi:MAG TPA: flavodoxin domain-containing protein [Chthonomonadaceae bacterium]|nr:flavodoxin domain-containing protein [Chthonomonadaceae bacterium]